MRRRIMWLPKISLLDLCLSVAFLALVFAAVGWLKGFVHLNHASEHTLILDEVVSVPWQSITWVAGHSGVKGGRTRLTYLPNRYDTFPAEDAIRRRRLISTSYDAHAGSETFTAMIDISGFYSSHKKLIFDLLGHGGGSKDGGFDYYFDFDPKSKLLKLTIRQWINSERIAKQATLRFRLEGLEFVYLNEETDN